MQNMAETCPRSSPTLRKRLGARSAAGAFLRQLETPPLDRAGADALETEIQREITAERKRRGRRACDR